LEHLTPYLEVVELCKRIEVSINFLVLRSIDHPEARHVGTNEQKEYASSTERPVSHRGISVDCGPHPQLLMCTRARRPGQTAYSGCLHHSFASHHPSHCRTQTTLRVGSCVRSPMTLSSVHRCVQDLALRRCHPAVFESACIE
jgi:hypothetical protein